MNVTFSMLVRAFRLFFLMVCLPMTLTHCKIKVDSMNNPEVEASSNELSRSTSKGLAFLQTSHQSSGIFASLGCHDSLMTECDSVSSPFHTAIILLSLRGYQDPITSKLRNGALNYLLAQQWDEGGVWSFDNGINPDLDDIANISHVLRVYDRAFLDNTQLILDNRDNEGRFNTWVDRGFDQRDPIDCVVNVNVLSYLGQNEFTEDACLYVVNNLKNPENSSIYYHSELSLIYFSSRAYREGVRCIGSAKSEMIRTILSMKQDDGSFGDSFHTAMALCSLIYLDQRKDLWLPAVNFLLNNQAENGSWEITPWYRGGPYEYWGSADLTTAIVLEAFAEYRCSLDDVHCTKPM